ELVLEPPLDDKVADTDEESVSDSVLFATGLGGISDIEVSPYDGYMYVVSLGQGKIFKILPTGEGDTVAGGTELPPTQPPPDVTPPPTVDEGDEDDSEEQDPPEQGDEEDEDEDSNDDEDDGDDDDDDDDEDEDE
ncbi:MAG: hypothetical protein ACRD8Z_20405, partial [Nitrososphaeraceae archaeon]